MEKKVELLAPAGNTEGFYGAIRAGADAVYLGGSRFGARAYAGNFTTEELISCIRYGHILNRKIYLTVNTLLKEKELPDLYDYLFPFYEAGLDGVIIQDMGVFRFIQKYFPGLELHASTQMTLCSKYGAKLLKDMGASRIVPARELSLEEIKTIKKDTDIELETFIHGAMCYCYSGQCLFSSILGGRSGNRGRCAQPCRLPYSVSQKVCKEGKNCYPLSLKDMCTITHIPELIESGIDSFKIEGRMKKAEYAAGVTAVYRKYIDSYYDLRERLGREEAFKQFSVEKSDFNVLSSLYIRSETHDGYYFKHNGREMVTVSNPAYSGSDDTLLAEIHKNFLEEHQRIPVRIEASFLTGHPASIRMFSEKSSVLITGAVVQIAEKQPITEENIRKQLSKMGDSYFFPEEIQISVSEDAFFSLKQINELRREAVLLLEQKILFCFDKENGRPNRVALQPDCNEIPQKGNRAYSAFEEDTHGYAISVNTTAQLETLLKWQKAHSQAFLKRIYVNGDIAVFQPEMVLPLCSELRKSSKVLLSFPYILRESDNGYLEKLFNLAENGLFDGFLIRSLDALGFLREKSWNKLCRADANLYIWNSVAGTQLSSAGIRDGFCIPYELNAGEQHRLLNTSEYPYEKIVYSRIPMMITANCVLKTTDKCHQNSTNLITLTDRYRKQFPVERNCYHCMNLIYNSVPLSLWQERNRWISEADLRLDFTLELPEKMEEILSAFLLGQKMPEDEYTAGHEKRGVE